MLRTYYKIVFVCFVVLFFVFFLLTMTVKREMIWVDAMTASVKYQTRWVWGYDTPQRIEQSQLELWARKNNQFNGYDWQYIAGTLQTLLGSPTGRACGHAPEIYSLHGFSINLFVKNATQEELNEFMKIMNTGTVSEKKDAVTKAFDIVFRAESCSDQSPAKSQNAQ